MSRPSLFEFKDREKHNETLFFTYKRAREYYHSARYHSRNPRFKQISDIGYLVALDLPKGDKNDLKFAKLCLEYESKVLNEMD